jgi:uncharacterized membrane protein YbaN (DUF454 family)
MQENEITKRKAFRRLALVALGWTLLLIGVMGLLVPVLPGGLLIVLGILLLDNQYPSLRRVLEKWRARFPILERAFSRFSSGRIGWHRRSTNNSQFCV